MDTPPIGTSDLRLQREKLLYEALGETQKTIACNNCKTLNFLSLAIWYDGSIKRCCFCKRPLN